MTNPLLDLKNLRTYFHTDIGTVKAVDDLNVQVKAGQTLGIVGESGSGKSVTSLTVMQLLPENVAKIEDGSKIIFDGRNVLVPEVVAEAGFEYHGIGRISPA